MKLIESKTLGTAQASIEFTSIPQDGTDLVILVSARGGVGEGNGVTLRPNGLTTNASSKQLYGAGSSALSNSYSAIAAGVINGSSETANTFSNSMAYITNYSSSSNKVFTTDGVMENNATAAYQAIVAGLWSNTAPITSLTFVTSDAQNFVAGTIISLYKITKGSDGIVTTS
jgi:hypothetical protein